MTGQSTNDETVSRFPAALKELRQEMEWSQEQLAYRAGLHSAYISQIERGLKSPSLRSLGQIADALGVSLSVLFRKVER
jgi:transcriptional regulator with XRE-family HTH domain